jgi:predicted aldo/keto reductase-like oxidoreductase
MKKKISRRDWLKAMGMAGLGTVALGTTLGADTAMSVTGTEEMKQGKVPTRPFGKTGVEVSSLSLGGMFDIPNNQLLLKQAIEWGVTYWDTANSYGGGKSERGIGKFFSRRRPELRKKIFLVTKSGERDPGGITSLLDRSLERMKTDYIDLYFIHAIRHIDELDTNTRKWAEKAKADGKIRFFGFSTHRNMEDCMLAAAKLGWIDGIMMTYNYRIMHSEKMKAAVNACVNAGIGLTAMKTQGGGQVRTESETELKLAGRFMKRGFTDKQAKLKAVWENPKIASLCSQMPNLTILMSNVAAAMDKAQLTSGDKMLLEQYARETGSTYCAACGNLCESALDADIPVSDIMRYMMYHHHYSDQDDMRHTFTSLTKDMCKQLLAVDFSPAEKTCPRKMRIGRIMREAIEVLG